MKLKSVISFLFALALVFTACEPVQAQTPDTITVTQASDGVGTWYVRTRVNGSYRLGVQNPYGLTTPSATISSAGTIDTINFLSGSTVVKRYPVAKFVPKETACANCSTTADIVNYWNWYKFQKPVQKVLIPGLTSVQRDSFYNWSVAPNTVTSILGVRIFNTTIDSPQIAVSGTIKWRNH